MSALKRLGVDVSCPGCSHSNTLLLPEASCGNEFIWHTRCGGCGFWRWFHSREDASFVLAIKETARRRDEAGGLSPQGTLEAHAAFEVTIDACACGGRHHVVHEILDEPCLGCGGSLRGVPLPEKSARKIDVPPLR